MQMPRVLNVMRVVLHHVLLHAKDGFVAASPQEPPLGVEVGRGLPRPHGGGRDGGAVTALPPSGYVPGGVAGSIHPHGPGQDGAHRREAHLVLLRHGLVRVAAHVAEDDLLVPVRLDVVVAGLVHAGLLQRGARGSSIN